MMSDEEEQEDDGQYSRVFWTEEQKVVDPVSDGSTPPLRPTYSVHDYHKDYSKPNDDIVVTPENSPRMTRVKFSDTKEIFHFLKAPIETDRTSFFTTPSLVDSDDEEEESDEEEEEEYEASDDTDDEGSEDDEVSKRYANRLMSFHGFGGAHRQDDPFGDEEDEDEDEDESDNNSVSSMNSVEESPAGTPDKPFFDLANYSPVMTSPVMTAQTSAAPEESPRLRAWATRPQVVRYTPRFPPPQPTTQDDEDDESDDEAEEDDEEDQEQDEDENEQSDDSDKLKDMVNKRMTVEKELQTYRDKRDHERRRLRLCFTQAKLNLKKKIESALLHLSANGLTSTTLAQDAENQTMKDELEEVLSSLSQLQEKTSDMEQSLYDRAGSLNDSTDDNNNNNSSTPSLVSEFIHLKQLVEKERKDTITRDRELEDITKDMLDMALQVPSSALLNGDNNANGSNGNSEKIDQMMADMGAREARESIMSNLVENLMADRESLSQTIVEMEDERRVISERFDQLVLELREMGENAVIRLQEIINEMTMEREELENSIRDAQSDRTALITELTTLNQQLENDRATNGQLLVRVEAAVKKLEHSELRCTHLQTQLKIVNRRLHWAESEAERLSKEMNRLLIVTSSSSGGIGSSSPRATKDNEKIRLALETIREKVAAMRDALMKEKDGILQMGSDLAAVVERGRADSTRTISSVKDFVLREVETTKLGIANKLTEINTIEEAIDAEQSEQPQQNDAYLLNEVHFQKGKLNEMQDKIIKLEGQILEITAENNSTIGDQVVQLMRMESKIRKMEAGISVLSDYKPLQVPGTPVPIQSTTITTTTTTQHHYIDATSPLLSPTMVSSSTPPTTTISSSTFTPISEEQQQSIVPSDDEKSSDSIGRILIDSVLVGASSFLTSVFFNILNNPHNPIQLDQLTRLGLQYGAGTMALCGIIRTALIPLDVFLSGVIGASLCGFVLYFKQKRPEHLIAGAVIGLGLGGMSRVMSPKNNNNNVLANKK
eukprot:gene11937-13912_t